MRAIWVVGFLAFLVTGCAGRVQYTPPAQSAATHNAVTVEKPMEVVWKELVAALGKKFFVVNNIDRASGFINLSYGGDPEAYVDCGQVSSYVKNARGERTFTFPGSKAHQQYEVMHNGTLVFFDRKMALEGRINLIVEEVEARRTRVTANTRYVLTRVQLIRPVTERAPISKTDTASFNLGGHPKPASHGHLKTGQ
jgi:hypothetical protein